MLFPYKDDNPTRRFALVTFLIILANTAMFLYQVFGGTGFTETTYQLGLIPAEISGGANLPDSLRVSPYVTLFSYMFCHGNIPHLVFNMLFLWIFGNNVEDSMSRAGYLAFYLLMGMISAFAFVALSPGLKTPLVGASGAISGILGAYLFMFPWARVHVLIFIFVVRMPAVLFLPIWFLLQVSGFMNAASGDGSNVAWISHIAGFIAGAILYRVFTRR